MSTLDGETLKAVVRETYGQIASAARSSGCCGNDGCCGASAGATSDAIGYSDEERQSVPEGADLGLGCGNPQTIASLMEGERVLDLGSGAGFDAFLAARQVGPGGFVIGVDMTAEMVTRARANTRKTDLGNVEFRLGEIEHLPVADASVDVIMSNCVINLSTDKPAVFREAFRVLVPGGRLALADIVALKDIHEATRDSLHAYTGCVSGAALVSVVDEMIRGAGFSDVVVEVRDSARGLDGVPSDTAAPVASALIRATKPLEDRR
jgi:SAM-dependent methyltransferase